MTLKQINNDIPELTSFEVSPFQREHDCIAYIAETIKMLGWDGGKELDTMDNWLYRLRKKAIKFKQLEIAVDRLKLFIYEKGMTAESDYEKAVLNLLKCMGQLKTIS